MLVQSRALTAKRSLLLLLGFIVVSLQGCNVHVYHHPDVEKIEKDGRGPIVTLEDDCKGAQGCNPTAYTGSAQGFVGNGGTNPVPAGYTCSAGSVKCGNENSTGCSLRYPTKKCKSTFTYQGGSTTGPCTCPCIY
jgi:hypothetical protein